MRPLISAIVCTYRREDLALRAVGSVLRGDFDDYELIVVDQDEAGRLGERLQERFGFAPRYCVEPRLGLSRARNAGVAASRGRLLAFLDDDAVAGPGWLRSYAEVFDSARGPTMVGGRILPDWDAPPPRWYPPGRRYVLGLYDLGEAVREFPATDLPIGANFAIRGEALERCGGFPPELGFSAARPGGVGGEDSWVGRRVREAGGRILYHPGAVVYHRIGPEKLRFRSMVKRHFVEGRTQLAVAAEASHVDEAAFNGAIRWHAASITKSAVRSLASLTSGRGLHETVGDWLAGTALSWGVIHESRQRIRELRSPAEPSPGRRARAGEPGGPDRARDSGTGEAANRG